MLWIGIWFVVGCIGGRLLFCLIPWRWWNYDLVAVRRRLTYRDKRTEAERVDDYVYDHIKFLTRPVSVSEFEFMRMGARRRGV